MTVGAIIMLIVAAVLLWGGLIASIVHLNMHNSRAASASSHAGQYNTLDDESVASEGHIRPGKHADSVE